jgi:hypothetical protein
MSDEPIAQEELDEQNGEAPSVVQPPSDPDLDVTLDPPKQSREPGVPPPRD